MSRLGDSGRDVALGKKCGAIRGEGIAMRFGLLGAALAIVTAVTTAQAAVVTFVGQDDGAPVGGPFTNSFASSNAFLAAASAFGTVDTHFFSGQPLGFSVNNTFVSDGTTFTLNATNFGPGFSGISNTTFGNLFGFNIQAPGAGNAQRWLGFPGGSVTFNFAAPTHSFGAFFTGLQGGPGVIVTFNDGSSQQINVAENANGGAQFFGLTDTLAFSALTISHTNDDAWGVDNVSFNVSVETPLPAAFPLFVAGLGVIGWLGRRRGTERESKVTTRVTV
jgi:hypothetical protein